MINPKHTAGRATGEILPFKPVVQPVAADSSATLETPALTFSWEALERQLATLAGSVQRRALVSTLVSGTRKQAAFKPPELLLREVLCLASVLMDETFHPDLEEGEMT